MVREGYWDYLEHLVTTSRIVIDRPRGTAHPDYPTLIYPLDYGYLEETRAADGSGVDVWLGSLPERTLDALALTVDLDRRDAEVKLLLGCTEAEKEAIMDFLNGATMRALLLRRQGELRWLQTRRSVRHFSPRAVPSELVAQLLEAATWAPSAHHRQPWRFAVVTSPEVKAQLAQAMGEVFRRDLMRDGLSEGEIAVRVGRSRERIQQAPLAIVLCLDTASSDAYPDAERQQAEYLMGAQSVALAGGHMLLAAHALGLGGVWMCAPLFAPHAVRQVLDVPSHWQPQALLLFGYPARTPPLRPRRPWSEVTRFY